MYEEHLCVVALKSIERRTQFFPLASYFLLPLLFFVYFRVNNGVLYFLDYEDIKFVLSRVLLMAYSSILLEYVLDSTYS